MACQHTDQASELRLRTPRGRTVDRVYKCLKCRRIVRRVRSRWASKRYHQYRPENDSMQARINRQRVDQYAREERSKPYAQRLHEELTKVRHEARYTFKDDAPLYHPLAIRYRRLLRKWWALPGADVAPYLDKGEDARPKGFAHVANFQGAVEKLERLYALSPDEAYAATRRAVHVFVRNEPLFWTRPDGIEAGARA